MTPRSDIPICATVPHWLASIAVTASLIWCGAHLIASAGVGHTVIAADWVTPGLAFAAGVVAGWWLLPGVLLGVALVVAGLDLTPTISCGWLAAMTVSCSGGALLRTWGHVRPAHLERVRGVALLIGVGGGLTAFSTALIIDVAQADIARRGWQIVVAGLAPIWALSAIGILAITPGVAAVLDLLRRPSWLRRPGEGVLAVAAIVLVATLQNLSAAEQGLLHIIAQWVPLPVLLWIAARHGVRRGSLTLVILAGVTWAGAGQVPQPASGPPPLSQVPAALVGLLLMYALTTLVFGTLNGERVRAVARQARRYHKLEHSLRERTSEATLANELLAWRFELDRLVTAISTDLVTVKPGQLNDAIRMALERLGRLVDVDRAYLFLFSEDGTQLSNTHEWCAPGIAPQAERLQNVPASRFSWLMERMQRDEAVCFRELDELPAAAAAERADFRLGAVRSLLALPMRSGDHVVGIIGFDCVTHTRSWGDELIALLRVIGDVFAGTLARERAECARRAAEDKYRSLFDMSQEGIVFTTLDGQFVDANKAYLDMLGYTRDELCRLNFRAVTPEKWSEIEAHIIEHQILTRGYSDEYEKEYIRGDGTIFPVSLRVWLVRDEQGTPVQMFGLVRDISERKKNDELNATQRELAVRLGATASLQEALQLCTAAALRAGRLDCGGVYLLDEDSEMLDLACVTGMRQEEAQALAHFRPFSPFARLVNEGQPCYSNYAELQRRLSLKRNTNGLLGTAIVPIMHDKRVIGCFTVYSRRRKTLGPATKGALETIAAQMGSAIARLKAESAHRRLAAAAAQSAEAILITDTNGRIEYVNPAFEQMTGYKADEVLGKTPRVLKSSAHDDAFYHQLWDTVLRGDTWCGRIVNKRKDGSSFHQDVTISPVRDLTGRTVNYVSVARDITQEIAQEAHTRYAQKMEAVGQLAGGVAHEFNNLLTAILGYSEVIAASTAADHVAARHATRIRESVTRAAELVRKLLAFGRKQMVQPRQLDLNDTVRETLRILRPVLGRGIRLETHLHEALGPVQADPDQLELLLTNLCLNAREAMPSGGTLTVETTMIELNEPASDGHAHVTPGSYVSLAVHDTGCGMDEATRARVFEPFFTTKDASEGAGLGLATVHGIVHQHGGRIVVHSVPNAGTTFRVYLPCSELETPQPATLRTPSANHQTTVLVVEDEEDVREVECDILQAEGYRVVSAENAAAALQVSKQFSDPIDLLVTDIVMPGMDGRELAQHVCKSRPDTRVLYISGYAQDILAPEDRLQPGSAFLPKPFSRTTFSEKVRAVLNTKIRATAS